ncbi:MAG: hypothetical protein AAF610_03785 [Pseudomonadota bacterium]
MLHPRYSPLLCLLALFAGNTAAGADGVRDKLMTCAQVGSPLDRLECYDALARTTGAVPAVPTPSAPPVAERSAPVPPAPARIPPTAPPAAVETAPALEQPVEDFGFENERIRKDKTEVVSRYDGQFTGWSGGTLFKLENGQVWKQSQSGRVSHRRDRPTITIKRGAFGSYRLSVEGLNRTVRVKRVK